MKEIEGRFEVLAGMVREELIEKKIDVDDLGFKLSNVPVKGKSATIQFLFEENDKLHRAILKIIKSPQWNLLKEIWKTTL